MRFQKYILFASALALALGFAEPAFAQALRKGNYDTAMSAFASGDLNLAGRHFWRLAQDGDERAQYYLAYMLDTGQGMGKDPYEAIKWYKRSAEKHFLPAVVYMGYAYATGHGVARDDVQAVTWYTKAAQMGDAVAQNNLATMLRKGQGIKQNSALAAQWYLQSALQGNARAQYNLGNVYREGDGVKRNYKEAVRWFSFAASQGDVYAQYALGYMYRTGKGVAQDDLQAVDWYRRSAEQGYMPAQYAIARMYEAGADGKTPADAFRWYLGAAEQGHEKSILRTAHFYEQGIGVEKDASMAVKWYQKAIEEHNYPSARLALAMLYERGSGNVKKDVKKAAALYIEGANYGHAESQVEAGRIYQNGIGVEKNLVEANKWYALAYRGLEEGELRQMATVGRIETGNQLDQAQLTEARRLAAQWRPKIYIPKTRDNKTAPRR